MESPKVLNGTMAASDETFPAANVLAELHPAKNKDFQVDPVSSDVATSLENKEREEVRRKKKAEERNDALQTLKSTIIVSGAILAVVGAGFVIAKKLKEK